MERHGPENWALCVAEPSGRGEAQNAVSVPGSAPAARTAPVTSSCWPCRKLLRLPAAFTQLLHHEEEEEKEKKEAEAELTGR